MKVIIWGYKLYSHSHSFIHYGFYRAFHYLGYETYWFDKTDKVDGFDFSNCLFLTEGNCMEGMPIREDGHYVLHNCPQIDGIKTRLNIQYLTYESYCFPRVSHGITYLDNCVYFPWGSPLLPNEFNLEDVDRKRNNNVYYLGSVDGKGTGGNYEAIKAFSDAAHEEGHSIFVGGGYTGLVEDVMEKIPGWITVEKEAELLRSGYMQPSVQGPQQLKNGMVPCRAFKSASYGLDVITNNPLTLSLFRVAAVFCPDCGELFYEAHKRQDEVARKKWLMSFVRDNHTYINNINAILECL